MQARGTLHPLVVELMGDLEIEGDQLRMSDDAFVAWFGRLRDLSPTQRTPVATDLAVLAARFRREAPESTDWAVHALMFFAIELAGSIEAAGRIWAAEGMQLSEESKKYVLPTEALKTAPGVQAGQSRKIDPELLRQQLRRKL